MDALRKTLKVIEYTLIKVVQMFFICLYLLVGSVGLVIITGMVYGGIKETIKFYNGETK